VQCPQHDRLGFLRCDQLTDERDLGERQRHHVVGDQRDDLRACRGSRGEYCGERGDVLQRRREPGTCDERHPQRSTLHRIARTRGQPRECGRGRRRQCRDGRFIVGHRRRGTPACRESHCDHCGEQQCEHTDGDLNQPDGGGGGRRLQIAYEVQREVAQKKQHTQADSETHGQGAEQNASDWSTGRGRETMRTVIPIRSGSAIAANAITSTAPHTTGRYPPAAGRAPHRRPGIRGVCSRICPVCRQVVRHGLRIRHHVRQLLPGSARERGRVRVTGGQFRVGLFAAVLALLCVNALALWSEQTAQWVFMALQAITGLGAIVCALVVVRRTQGPATAWRLVVVAAFVTSLVGDLLWYAGRVGALGTAPPLAVAAYFLPPLLTLVIAVLVVRSSGAMSEGRDGPSRGSRLITVFDGLVAAITFLLLVEISGFGDRSGAVLPRSANTAVLVFYALLELVVVVTAVLTAITYRQNRAYRTNYLLLTCGVVTIASSDRIVTYLRTVGLEGGQLWGSIGFVLGQLLIAYAVLDLPPYPASRRAREAVDWVQLTLPYVGFLGMAVLYSFHIYIEKRLNAFELSAAVLLVFLVSLRQMIATRSHRQLTQRLYDAQGRLAHQVHHDSLTGLPNRLLLGQRLDDAIRSGPFVLIFVDLDDFKEVNDRFGHAGGDELLCAVGERLQRCIGKPDTLARIGGDEFAILIDGELEAPEVVADRIRVALRDPFAIHGSSIRVRASMGLVRPEVGETTPTSDDLLRQADVSMYAGKRVGKDTAVIYRPSLGVSTDFPTALRRAKGGIPVGFSLAYQPVVRLPDTTPVAVEALRGGPRPTEPTSSPTHSSPRRKPPVLAPLSTPWCWISPAASSSPPASTWSCMSTSARRGWAARNSSGRSAGRWSDVA
jgi:diguanylate cyclase (GGDEF)-like protein